jgi:hypothetical protein
MTDSIDKARIIAALTEAAQPGLQTVREVDRLIAAINAGDYDSEPVPTVETLHLVLATPVGVEDTYEVFVELEDAAGASVGGFQDFVSSETGYRHIVIPRYLRTSEVGTVFPDTGDVPQPDRDPDGNLVSYEFGQPEDVPLRLATETYDEWISRAVFTLVGAASTCWGGGTLGVFDEARARNIAGGLVGLIKSARLGTDVEPNPDTADGSWSLTPGNATTTEGTPASRIAAATQAFMDSVHGTGEYVVIDWAMAIQARYVAGPQDDWSAGLPELVTYVTEPSGSIGAEVGILSVIHAKLRDLAAGGNRLAKSE